MQRVFSSPDSGSSLDNEYLLEVKHVSKSFGLPKTKLFQKQKLLHAVNDVSLRIREGENFGLVGESGCGKSTIGRLILNLDVPSSGEVIFNGDFVHTKRGKELKFFRKSMQLIFQDSLDALNPRRTIFSQLDEVLRVHNVSRDRAVRRGIILDLLESVDLSEDVLTRYPIQLSGGQRQRLVIARALLLHPRMVICDEPVASVDVFLQSQIVKLLKSMQVERDITYLVISHDLHLVHDICQRIAVIYLGKIVETSGCDLLFDQPKHPYTRFLLGSVPVKNPKLRANRELLEGDVPSPINIPSGCSFHTRCPQKMDVCSRIEPELLSYDNGCRVACHLYTNQHLIDV
ncbi:MAG: ABC transporter ATP-binding protein [Bacteroidetes bacterium]|nr:ABC transporter ATP-binding protein [Bacteroidota bacterium]